MKAVGRIEARDGMVKIDRSCVDLVQVDSVSVLNLLCTSAWYPAFLVEFFWFLVSFPVSSPPRHGLGLVNLGL